MIWRAIALVLIVAAPAAAKDDPVYLACRGQTLLPDKRVDPGVTLSLAIDPRANTVTIEGNQAATILPGPQSNQIEFLGSTLGGAIHGDVDRITGTANITFQVNTSGERFFSGVCQPAEKLF